jgi:hypothetical protein
MDDKRPCVRIFRPCLFNDFETSFYYGNKDCIIFGSVKAKLFVEKGARDQFLCQFYLMEAPQVRYFGRVTVDATARIVINHCRHRIIEQLLTCRNKFSCVKRLFFYFVTYLGVRVDAQTLKFIQEIHGYKNVHNVS